jgi:hypothetical protein
LGSEAFKGFRGFIIIIILIIIIIIKRSSSPFTGLEWPSGFQEVKVPRSHDNGTGWL